MVRQESAKGWLTGGSGVGCHGERAVDLPGDVALEAADGVGAGEAFGGAPLCVGSGVAVAGEPGERDDVRVRAHSVVPKWSQTEGYTVAALCFVSLVASTA
jgi:hypothetical protein